MSQKNFSISLLNAAPPIMTSTKLPPNALTSSPQIFFWIILSITGTLSKVFTLPFSTIF